MARDPYSAVWVSHSSIGKFLQCPRAYYLAHIYKNPKTGNRIGLMQPALALGQAVHNVLESLSVIPTEERFSRPLLARFEEEWEKVSGKLGGFSSSEEEGEYKERGKQMISRVSAKPGVLARRAVKIKQEDTFPPHYLFSEKDNIILCGKVDWLEYLPEGDAVHIVDFKTGKHDEDEDSLQLPIYLLLTVNCQKRKVSQASYWYLDRADEPQKVALPNIRDAYERVLAVAKRVKLARELRSFKCPKGEVGCFVCRPFEIIYRGGGELVGTSDSKQDVYVIPLHQDSSKEPGLQRFDTETIL